MRHGAVLVNTSGGALADYGAVVTALRAGRSVVSASTASTSLRPNRRGRFNPDQRSTNLVVTLQLGALPAGQGRLASIERGKGALVDVRRHQYRCSTLANEANRREAKQSFILPPNVHILIDRAAGEDHYLDLIQCDGKCGGPNQQHNYHGGRKRSHQRAADSECRDNRYVGE